jgi:hypothetical protein
VEDAHGYEDREGDYEDLGGDAVEADAGVVAGEEVGLLADGLALAGGVAVGDAGEMDVGVGVGAGEVEEAVAAATGLVAELAGPSAAALGVALSA